MSNKYNLSNSQPNFLQLPNYNTILTIYWYLESKFYEKIISLYPGVWKVNNINLFPFFKNTKK